MDEAWEINDYGIEEEVDSYFPKKENKMKLKDAKYKLCELRGGPIAREWDHTAPSVICSECGDENNCPFEEELRLLDALFRKKLRTILS